MSHTIEDHALPVILQALRHYAIVLQLLIESGRGTQSVKADYRHVLDIIKQTEAVLEAGEVK